MTFLDNIQNYLAKTLKPMQHYQQTLCKYYYCFSYCIESNLQKSAEISLKIWHQIYTLEELQNKKKAIKSKALISFCQYRFQFIEQCYQKKIYKRQTNFKSVSMRIVAKHFPISKGNMIVPP